MHLMGFSGVSDGKESACNAGDPGLIPGWEDLLEKEIANHSSIFVLENPMDRGAYRPWGHKSQTLRLNTPISLDF